MGVYKSVEDLIRGTMSRPSAEKLLKRMKKLNTLTPRQQKLRKLHTKIVKNFDGKRTVELVVGCQYFTLDIGPEEPPSQILNWHRDMLAVALSYVGKKEPGKP